MNSPPKISLSVSLAGSSLYLEVNGLHYHCLTYGNDGARPLILIPGITSPAAAADFIAALLAKRGFYVVVPDLRGRGETDRAPSGCYRMEDYVADLAVLIATLDLKGASIIGHSLGARIAAAYATRYEADTHGLLVLVDPPVSGPSLAPYPTTQGMFLAQLRDAQEGTTAEAVQRYYPLWPERELQLRAEILVTCDETAVIETHRGFETEDFFGDWAKITQPAVLIRGSDSAVVTPQSAIKLAEVNPTIPIITIPDAGHMVPWDNQDGFFASLDPFIIEALSI